MFEITTVFNHKALTALCRSLRKTLKRRSDIVIRVLGVLFIALEAVFSLLLFLLGAFIWDFSMVVMVLLALILLGILFFEDHLNGWISAGLTYGYKRETSAVLDEEEYVITLPNANGHWKYDTIRVFCETKDYFVFLVDKKHGQLFDKSGFTKGTPDEFRSFITEKTGLPVKYIK